MAVTAPPSSELLLAEIRRRKEPFVPESVKVVEFWRSTRLPVVRLPGLSAIRATLLAPSEGSSLIPELFFTVKLPLIQTGPERVRLPPLLTSKLQLIFFGPRVT